MPTRPVRARFAAFSATIAVPWRGSREVTRLAAAGAHACKAGHGVLFNLDRLKKDLQAETARKRIEAVRELYLETRIRMRAGEAQSPWSGTGVGRS